MLTQAVAEDLSVRFGIKWNFRELKTSQLAAVASGKQPKTLPNLIHEFAAVVPIHGVSVDVTFPLSGKQQLKRCYNFVSSSSSSSRCQITPSHGEGGDSRCDRCNRINGKVCFSF